MARAKQAVEAEVTIEVQPVNHSPGPTAAAEMPLYTKDEAIECAKQLRRDQGGERLLRYLRGE